MVPIVLECQQQYPARQTLYHPFKASMPPPVTVTGAIKEWPTKPAFLVRQTRGAGLVSSTPVHPTPHQRLCPITFTIAHATPATQV